MHFRIKRIKLLNALAKATRAVSVRSPLPVLTGIKFDLQAHQLILTGSDSDITIQTIIDEDDDLVILKEGAVVLNSRYIFDIVRKINSDDIEIEIIDGLLTRIKGSQIEYSLNGTDAIEYPRIDLSKTGTHFMMNALVLKDIIGETKFAASDKETRPILTGINFKAHDHVLECVATDSYRLAKKIISIDEDVTFNITIPKLSLDEISKIIEKDELIELYVSERKVLFVFDKNIIQTRLIDGSYPDTTRLIPLEFDYELDMNEVRIDITRASGCGGQGVNTTDSAVRLTHIPTGIVVYSQTERSQIKNKEKAIKILKTRLYDLKLREKEEKEGAERRSKIGTGDRSEKIRTYNYPQNRVTDHRIGFTINTLDRVMQGDLEKVIEALITEDQARKLRGE